MDASAEYVGAKVNIDVNPTHSATASAAIDYVGIILAVLCKQHTAIDIDILNWAVPLVLTFPHVLYAFVWIRPELWRNLCGSYSTPIFAALCIRLKFIQIVSIVFWVWASREAGLCFDLSNLTLSTWLCFLVIQFTGKMLIWKSYQVSGAHFFYAGRLEGTERASNAFPYTIMSHPECLGSVLTTWALPILVMSQLPQGTTFLLAYASLLSVFTALVEDYLKTRIHHHSSEPLPLKRLH
eukprot:gene9801-7690_t